ncbi:hypothetical protein ACIBF1_02170 [Spirillospora sp. NPDC050679]
MPTGGSTASKRRTQGRRWKAAALGGVLVLPAFAMAETTAQAARSGPVESMVSSLLADPAPGALPGAPARHKAPAAGSGGPAAQGSAPGGDGAVRLAATISPAGRAARSGAQVFNYVAEVRPLGGTTRDTSLILLAQRPLAWEGVPRGCAAQGVSAPLHCDLGDLAQPWRTKLTVRLAPSDAGRKPPGRTEPGTGPGIEPGTVPEPGALDAGDAKSALDAVQRRSAAQGHPPRIVAVAAARNVKDDAIATIILPESGPKGSQDANGSKGTALPGLAPTVPGTPVRPPKPGSAPRPPAPPKPGRAAAPKVRKAAPPKSKKARPERAPVREPRRPAAPRPPRQKPQTNAPMFIKPPAPAPAPPAAQAPLPLPGPAFGAEPEPVPSPPAGPPAPGVPALPVVPPSGPPMDLPTTGPSGSVLPTFDGRAGVALPPGAAGDQMTLISPTGMDEEGGGIDWAVVLGITLVAEVGLLWLAACLGLWRRRTALARTARLDALDAARSARPVLPARPARRVPLLLRPLAAAGRTARRRRSRSSPAGGDR